MEEIAEIEERITFEEMRENQERERILLKEAAGEFPEWNELSDEKLVKSLVMLNEKEREHDLSSTYLRSAHLKRLARDDRDDSRALQGCVLLCNP